MSGNWFFQKLCSMPVGEQKTVSKLSLFLSVPFCLTSALFHSLTFLRNKFEEQEKAEEKNQVLPVAFLLIWRLSSTLNKFKDGEREERTARISAWKQQRLKRDQRQPVLSSYYFFTPLLIFEKPGPMNVLKMSRSNIILKENKLPLYFLFSTLHEHLPKHCVPCCPGASARPGAARGMTGSLQVTSESSC